MFFQDAQAAEEAAAQASIPEIEQAPAPEDSGSAVYEHPQEVSATFEEQQQQHSIQTQMVLQTSECQHIQVHAA